MLCDGIVRIYGGKDDHNHMLTMVIRLAARIRWAVWTRNCAEPTEVPACIQGLVVV